MLLILEIIKTTSNFFVNKTNAISLVVLMAFFMVNKPRGGDAGGFWVLAVSRTRLDMVTAA